MQIHVQIVARGLDVPAAEVRTAKAKMSSKKGATQLADKLEAVGKAAARAAVKIPIGDPSAACPIFTRQMCPIFSRR